MIRLLHIIERFSVAGPERALMALARVARRNEAAQIHRVTTLEPLVSPVGGLMARSAGLELIPFSGDHDLRRSIEESDIVLLHYWNSPAVNRFLRLARSPMRLLLWLRVYGEHAPHVLTSSLVEYSSEVIVGSPGTLDLQSVASRPDCPTTLIYSPIDTDRLSHVAREAHSDFRVGYIGTINYAKMHESFLHMSAAIDVPDLRIVVCGAVSDEKFRQDFEEFRGDSRFDLRGYVEDIGKVLHELDVFGYPLCPNSYASSERVLQEAMWVGLPVVVMPHAGIRHMVRDGETGIVVNTEEQYIQAIRFLYANPAERRRLGANARAFARKTFDPAASIQRLNEIFERMMEQPKKNRIWPDTGERASDWFVHSLGQQSVLFDRSRRGKTMSDRTSADLLIARSPVVLTGGQGGIIHWRNTYPEDPWLRYWSGLVLWQTGDFTKAQVEFEAAVRFGLPPSKVDEWSNGSVDSPD